MTPDQLEILSCHVDGEQPTGAALDRALADPESAAVLGDFRRIGQTMRDAAGTPSIGFAARVQRELARELALAGARRRRRTLVPAMAAAIVAVAAGVTWIAVRAPDPAHAPARPGDTAPARAPAPAPAPATAPSAAAVSLWGHVQVVPIDGAEPTIDVARRVADSLKGALPHVTRSRVSAGANELVARVGLAWARVDVHAVDRAQMGDAIAGFQIVRGARPDALSASSAPPVYIGRHLAHLLGAVVDDELRLELPDTGSPASPAVFRIGGIVDTGNAHLDRALVVVPIGATGALPLSPRIALWVRDPADAAGVAADARAPLAGTPWAAAITSHASSPDPIEVTPTDLWHFHIAERDLAAALAADHPGLAAFPVAIGAPAVRGVGELMARFPSLDREAVTVWVELSSRQPATIARLSFFVDDGAALLARLARTWGDPVRGDDLGRPLSIWHEPPSHLRVIARGPGRPGSETAADDNYAIDVEPYTPLDDVFGRAGSARFGIERMPLVGAAIADVRRAYGDAIDGTGSLDFPPVEWGNEPVSLRLELDAAGDRVTAFELELDVRYAPARVADLRARTRAKLGRSRLVGERDGERVYEFPDNCHVRLTTASLDRGGETIWRFAVASGCQ